MKPIFKVSLYFLIVLVLSIVGPMFVTPVLYKIGLVPPLVLMVIHIIFFIVPAIIYIIVTKSNYKRFLALKTKGKRCILFYINSSFSASNNDILLIYIKFLLYK